MRAVSARNVQLSLSESKALLGCIGCRYGPCDWDMHYEVGSLRAFHLTGWFPDNKDVNKNVASTAIYCT